MIAPEEPGTHGNEGCIESDEDDGETTNRLETRGFLHKILDVVEGVESFVIFHVV